jgi:hypothetical protein
VSYNYNAIAKFLPSCALFRERNVVLSAFPVGTVESMDYIVCLECLSWVEFADSDMAFFYHPENTHKNC